MITDLGGVTPINFNDGGNTVMGVTPVLPPLLVNSEIYTIKIYNFSIDLTQRL